MASIPLPLLSSAAYHTDHAVIRCWFMKQECPFRSWPHAKCVALMQLPEFWRQRVRRVELIRHKLQISFRKRRAEKLVSRLVSMRFLYYVHTREGRKRNLEFLGMRDVKPNFIEEGLNRCAECCPRFIVSHFLEMVLMVH